MPILKDAGIPVITVGVRTDSLTDRKRQDRLAGLPAGAARRRGRRPRSRSMLVELWRERALRHHRRRHHLWPRACRDAARRQPSRQALKPVFVDTFRPQLDNQIGLAGRLRKAGATHVFVGGDRDDIAIIGRDAAGLGL